MARARVKIKRDFKTPLKGLGTIVLMVLFFVFFCEALMGALPAYGRHEKTFEDGRNIHGRGHATRVFVFANVLGIPLDTVKTEQGPGYGGAMLAMVGCGRFTSVKEAAEALVEAGGTTEPDPALTARYEDQYRKFSLIYPALKNIFPKIR